MKKCKSCQSEIDNKAKICPQCRTKQGNWVQRHPILTVIIVLIIFSFGSGGGNKTKTDGPSTPSVVNQDAKKEEVGTEDKISPTAIIEDKPSETVSQKNAVRKAESYLSYTGFSRSGLIKQLEFEKFSNSDAVYAVDKISPNWNEQAAKKAKSYDDYSGFSREGMINQLEFEGFTAEQAAFGADSVGL